MKIDKLLYEHFAELRLRGEFDTFYAPKLQEEVDHLISAGILYAVLNLRLVKFLNSTALGAILKAHKRFRAEGGEMVLCQPSAFCRDVIVKLGLDRVVPMFDDMEEARAHLEKAMPGPGAPGVLGDSQVLVHLRDPAAVETLEGNPTLLGRVLSVDHEGMRFTWDGGRRGLTKADLCGLFPVGAKVHTRFQVKLCKKGFFEVDGLVKAAQYREDEDGKGITVDLEFVDIGDSDRLALAQFADDLDYLKRQLEDL